MTDKENNSEAPAQPKYKGSFDWASATAFVGATVLGIASVINHVHNVFLKKYVMNRHDGERTPYADKYDEYYSSGRISAENGKHLTAEEAKKYKGKIYENARLFSEDKLTATEYMAERKKLTHEFREACDLIGEKKLGIPFKNKLEKWTVGTWKKAAVLGSEVQNEALIRFGTVAIVGLGAVAVLKHSRNVLDRIEQRLADHETGKTR